MLTNLLNLCGPPDENKIDLSPLVDFIPTGNVLREILQFWTAAQNNNIPEQLPTWWRAVHDTFMEAVVVNHAGAPTAQLEGLN